MLVVEPILRAPSVLPRREGKEEEGKGGEGRGDGAVKRCEGGMMGWWECGCEVGLGLGRRSREWITPSRRGLQDVGA